MGGFNVDHTYTSLPAPTDGRIFAYELNSFDITSSLYEQHYQRSDVNASPHQEAFLRDWGTMDTSSLPDLHPEQPFDSAEKSTLGFLLPSQYGSGPVEPEQSSSTLDQDYLPPMHYVSPMGTSQPPVTGTTAQTSPLSPVPMEPKPTWNCIADGTWQAGSQPSWFNCPHGRPRNHE